MSRTGFVYTDDKDNRVKQVIFKDGSELTLSKEEVWAHPETPGSYHISGVDDSFRGKLELTRTVLKFIWEDK